MIWNGYITLPKWCILLKEKTALLRLLRIAELFFLWGQRLFDRMSVFDLPDAVILLEGSSQYLQGTKVLPNVL